MCLFFSARPATSDETHVLTHGFRNKKEDIIFLMKYLKINTIE